MIFKFSLIRLSIIFLLVILLPLVQKQWLNLYLFDINNLTIYKFLYYLSGLICPIFIIRSSLNNFTSYKFNNKIVNNKYNNNRDIRGWLLLLTTSFVLFILSGLISNHILINLRIALQFLFSDNKTLGYFDIDKQILIVLIVSILLLFKKLKLFIKQVSLINFFIMSVIIWYSDITNKILNETVIINFLKFENINYINLLFLFSIEIFYYLWSYISYGSNLSDWRLSKPNKKEVISISNIIIFYLLIFLYYYLLL